MKFLLVLALALVAVSAQEEKKEEQKALPYAFGYSPLAYNTYGYNYPTFYNNLAYNTAPYAAQAYAAYPYAYPQVQIKPVEKEVEVIVKKYEFETPANSCFNSFGAAVPCRVARSADEEMKPEEEKKIVPLNYGFPLAYTGYPTMYNQFYNQYPLAYNYPAATYGYPLVYTTPYGCTNFKGEQVACRVTRSADEEEMKPEEAKKVTPLTYGLPLAYSGYPTLYNQYYNQYPLAYNQYNQYPLAYNYPAVTYTAPKPIIKEVEYLKPVLKEVVEKIPLVPACRNAFGLAVPCADYE